MWCKRGEEARSSKERSEVFWMWRRRAQEVGVSIEERKEKSRGKGTPTRGVGESEET